MTAMQLRAEFALEANCHRAIVGRCNSGPYVLDAEFREFRRFLWHMGPRPAPDWSVDRRDPRNPVYGPGLCRWASPRTQANNRGVTVHLTARGEIRPLTHWAQLTGQNPKTIAKRLERGWTDEEAISGERGGSVEPSPAPAPATDAAQWPSLMNHAKVPEWEGAFLLYTAHVKAAWGRVPKGLTRPAFAGWLIGNTRRAMFAELQRRHPGYGHPEIHPEDFQGWAAVRADPLFADETRYEGIEREACRMMHGDPDQWEQMERHRERWPKMALTAEWPEIRKRLARLHPEAVERVRAQRRIEAAADRIRDQLEAEWADDDE